MLTKVNIKFRNAEFIYCMSKVQRVLNDLQRNGLDRYDLAPRPPPAPPPVSKRGTHRKTEKERKRADGREGKKEGGQGAESYDLKKAWSSINHLTLSGTVSQRFKYHDIALPTPPPPLTTPSVNAACFCTVCVT
jgi:hypothetical protein